MQRSQSGVSVPVGNRSSPSRGVNARDHFDIHLTAHTDGFLQRLSALAQYTARTAFQSERWLGTWCQAIGIGAGTPLLVEIRDRRSDALVAALPLIRRRAGGVRIVEFADCGVSDYNGPILGPASISNDDGLRTVWATLKRRCSQPT